MAYFDGQQFNAQFNPQQWQQWAWPYLQNLQMSQTQPMAGLGIQGYPHGLGQAAVGQPYLQYGGFGQQHFGQPYLGAWGGNPWGQSGWGFGQQRQLSPQDVGEVVRQLVPLLPQIVAQAQTQPQAAIGYGPFGQPSRLLTQQDVNEVVRQILPIIPQVVGMLQGQGPFQTAAIHGGAGIHNQWGQNPVGQNPFGQGFGQQQNPFAQQNPFGQLFPLAQNNWQQPFAYPGLAAFQSPFANALGFGQPQRQLSQQDVTEVVRQLVGVIPQVIGNLQGTNQQRMI
jgi:hypothetical protein